MGDVLVLTFLAYAPENEAEVEVLALRLRDEAGVAVWFGPWDIAAGDDSQEAMERGLARAQVCVVCISNAGGQVVGWQNQQMRAAIMQRVQGGAMRVIPLLLPGTAHPRPEQLPLFLQLYEPVVFSTLDDDMAFKKLLAGILRAHPAAAEDYPEARRAQPQPVPESAEPPKAGDQRKVMPQNLQTIAVRKKRRLEKLEEQAAIKGINTPPEVLTEIDDLRREIGKLEGEG